MNFYLPAGSAQFRRSGFRIFALLFFAVILSGCAGRLNRAGELFYADQPQRSLSTLEKGDWFGQRNQLLFLLERGLVLHRLQRYQQSVEVLLQATELIAEFEQISVSEQLGSLVTTEWLVRYKGEYSERLWAHSYLMMNFLLLGQHDSALVEAKRALELLGRYPEALQEDYFTRGLIALCFSHVGEDNDAYLVYRRLAEDLHPTAVAVDLVQISARLGQLDEVAHYQPYLPSLFPHGVGELVLFVANGRIPKKRPGNVILPPSIRFSFPYYEAFSAPRVQVDILPRSPALPQLSSSLGAVAGKALEERKLSMIAKETLRVAGKEAIAQSVGNEHGGAAEAAARVTLFLLEEPDTRSWQTLPGRLTLVRVPLPVGRHKLRVEIGTPGFAGPRVVVDLPELELRKGQRVFHSVRLK